MSTAIGAQSGCEHSTKKSRVITFKNEEHKEFYQNYLQKCRTQDCYHKALIYCLGLEEDTRDCIERIYDFKTGCVKTKCLQEGWITSGTGRIIEWHLICIVIALLALMNIQKREISWRNIEVIQ